MDSTQYGRHLIALACSGLVTLAACGGDAQDPPSVQSATAEQAATLEQAVGGDAVQVFVECCGEQAEQQAVQIAYGMQAAQNLPNSAPFIVRADDRAAAARVAARLTDAGITRVIVVGG